MASAQSAPADSSRSTVANNVAASIGASSLMRHLSPRPTPNSSQTVASDSSAPQLNASSPAVAALTVTPSAVPAATSAVSASSRPAVGYTETASYDSPVTQLSSSAPPVIRLATSGTTSGATSNMAQSASSTWPGYSNLMYCDPVVCSGPMQVVHIKVPVRQVKPNLGQTEGNTFVNAEVVIGPDGVARAIRVAN
jgi:hypothetical protein